MSRFHLTPGTLHLPFEASFTISAFSSSLCLSFKCSCFPFLFLCFLWLCSWAILVKISSSNVLPISSCVLSSDTCLCSLNFKELSPALLVACFNLASWLSPTLLLLSDFELASLGTLEVSLYFLGPEFSFKFSAKSFISCRRIVRAFCLFLAALSFRPIFFVYIPLGLCPDFSIPMPQGFRFFKSWLYRYFLAFCSV